jgi:shikimate kinase
LSGPTERIWMVGMMGSGKSTVGAVLAGRLGWALVDTDALIEQRTGQRIARLWSAQGEAAFRAWEGRVIDEVSAAPGPVVISVGGGAVLDPANRERMTHSGLVVWLRADVRTLVARVGTGETRPVLGDDPEASLTRVDAARRAHYQDVADLVVDVDGVGPERAVDVIMGSARGALARA